MGWQTRKENEETFRDKQDARREARGEIVYDESDQEWKQMHKALSQKFLDDLKRVCAGDLRVLEDIPVSIAMRYVLSQHDLDITMRAHDCESMRQK